MKIAAVVVTYNRKELLGKCLEALLRQTRPLDEIIVIDNASTDGTGSMLSAEFPTVTHIVLPKNIGGAGGFHEGIKLAYDKGYDWVWVMDDDAVASDDALEKLLIPEVLKNSSVYALSSTVLNPDGSIDLVHRRFFDANKVMEMPCPHENYSKQYFEVDTASFVGLLISRCAIAKVGLPLKDFFIYYDDTEYSLRIRSFGGAIVNVPGSKIVHHTVADRGNSRRRPLTWRDFYGQRNSIYTYRKYGKGKVRFYLRVAARALRTQAGILLFRPQKLSSSLLLWRSTLEGTIGRLTNSVGPARSS